MSENQPEPEPQLAPKAEPLDIRPAVYDVIEKADKHDKLEHG